MKWKKINPKRLPGILEVLAANFSENHDQFGGKLLGSLERYPLGIRCVNDEETLLGCTHYIDIHKHDHERE